MRMRLPNGIQVGVRRSRGLYAGFMPAFKYNLKNFLAVFERGHKAHGYVQRQRFPSLSTPPLRKLRPSERASISLPVLR